MNVFHRIFLDTAPIIYYLERNEEFYPIVKQFICNENRASFFTSTVTVTEYLTIPYRKSDFESIQRFYEFIREMHITLCAIDRTAADLAAQIRGTYAGFKTMDALQLAVARISRCELFLTNDRQLLQFRELRCLTLSSLSME